MDQVHVVSHKVLMEGLTIRRVAREMGISRNAVRKYLRVSEPVRQEKRPRARLTGEKAAPLIDGLLEEWGPPTTPRQRRSTFRSSIAPVTKPGWPSSR